ncbi:radical SAM protein [Chitinimonas arctica]|uniref:Radical SAM protein n=1 Tax=Chitinimonas arctica TaxID=2594795 RepID=A0A516SMQ8_9NEIS|nr:radical SAM protein [Chitinimonas arctica]
MPLLVTDHRRDILGFRYIYPVVSRRAGGVSVGINLNPNNACNWRCIYCQVPDLVRGNAPQLDLAVLEAELAAMLDDIVHGDFMQRNVPEDVRRLNDLALSGNGEPTSSRQFGDVVTVLGRQLAHFGLLGKIKLVLITNGSQLYKPMVQEALTRMREMNGEVWFKYDRAPQEGVSFVNQVALTPAQIKRHLILASTRCPTWLQTCMFAVDGEPPAETELGAWLGLLREAIDAGARPEGVLLYGLARPSTQPEAPRLTRLPETWMRDFAGRIEQMGLPVKLSL